MGFSQMVILLVMEPHTIHSLKMEKKFSYKVKNQIEAFPIY